MKIARVFARRTSATPDDELAFTTPPPKILPEVDEIHVSTTFSYDVDRAEQLAESWCKLGVPVKFGGVATGDRGGDFTPGLYLKCGLLITSRGCNNACKFCDVHRREGGIRELPITEGHNILDSNLLQCSENHIRAVFDMLKRQPEKPVFTGGLEAKLLREWHVELLREVKARRIYFAYDTEYADYDALVQAGKLLRDGGISKASNIAKAYVLCGYPGDSFEKAEKRLRAAWAAGFFPFSMLYRDKTGKVSQDWSRFQREWVRPQIVYHKLREGATQ